MDNVDLCKTCDWRARHGNYSCYLRKIEDNLYCTIDKRGTLFEDEEPCVFYKKQEFAVPRGEWVGPTWNY